MSTLHSVALRHFAGGQRKECEVTRRAAPERRQILEARRKWRYRSGDFRRIVDGGEFENLTTGEGAEKAQTKRDGGAGSEPVARPQRG